MPGGAISASPGLPRKERRSRDWIAVFADSGFGRPGPASALHNTTSECCWQSGRRWRAPARSSFWHWKPIRPAPPPKTTLHVWEGWLGRLYLPCERRMTLCRSLKLAIVSLLFNWPSSGGGVMHTAGLGKALRGAGHQVKHFYACYPEFGVGNVEAPGHLDGQAISFDAGSWHREEIKRRFGRRLIVSLPRRCWSPMPGASSPPRPGDGGLPGLLRFDGQECLCPLNKRPVPVRCERLRRPVLLPPTRRSRGLPPVPGNTRLDERPPPFRTNGS